MKLINSILVLAWSVLILIRFGDIKAQEDIIMFLLACISMLVSVVNILDFAYNRK